MSDRRTALVLGGGGITGIAWEIGLLAGLAEAGTDLSGADLVVGTSAGSVVGALLTGGADLADLYERQLAPATGEKARAPRPGHPRPVRLGHAAQPRQRRGVPAPDRGARPRGGEGRAHAVRAGTAGRDRRAAGRHAVARAAAGDHCRGGGDR